ncbi:NAD(P)-binding protein [Aspergillus steynii IBT 23096]|uniref:NAD(P)-binding protein n=1 Tax=Aspergillus steynii IBT 23096 TaxID=1392250 RepID=A0A2I2GQ10_9EURO|nr:NAD(P)-binding protein [Aspergillus steynii IBT 23096]PLB54963.1 NAD(P)-binding protein [Aspergillus steynii IBT 23096]
MQATKAIVAAEPTSPGTANWSLQDVQCPISCGPGEVLVEIVATGLCHTDVFVSGVPEGAFGIRYPKILGHEGAGFIRALGPNPNTSLRLNDPVLLTFPSCAACAQCRQDHPAHCTSLTHADKYTGKKNFAAGAGAGAGDRNGAEDPSIWGSFLGQSSFARHTVVTESACFSLRGLLRRDSDLALFAPLGCSYLTGSGAVRRIAKVGTDDVVLVMGLGGVGMAALLTTIQSSPSTIIAVDQHPARLRLAQALGATHTLNTRAKGFNLRDAVAAIAPAGPSVVIDTTGVPELMEPAMEVAAPRARIVLVGIPPPGYVVGMQGLGFVESGKSIMGCLVGDSVPGVDIPQIIQSYYEGRFPVDRLVTKVPAEDYEKALRGVEAGEIIKAVLVWE